MADMNQKAGIHAISTTSMCEVWIVRHGERIDETEGGDKWYYTTPKSVRFDPPLTRVGEGQAQQAGKMLQELVLEHGVASSSKEPFFDTVYTSPMQRCLSTAHQLISTLNQSPDNRFHVPNGLVVIPGLAECAAAARRAGVDNLDFLPADQMMKTCPTILNVNNCWHHDSPRFYQDALNWIVHHEIIRTENVLRRSRVLIVAHREAIRDLLGTCSRVPYCAIAAFHANNSTNANNRSKSFDDAMVTDTTIEQTTNISKAKTCSKASNVIDMDRFAEEVDNNYDSDDSNDAESGGDVGGHHSYDYVFENVFDPVNGKVVPIH